MKCPQCSYPVGESARCSECGLELTPDLFTAWADRARASHRRFRRVLLIGCGAMVLYAAVLLLRDFPRLPSRPADWFTPALLGLGAGYQWSRYRRSAAAGARAESRDQAPPEVTRREWGTVFAFSLALVLIVATTLLR